MSKKAPTEKAKTKAIAKTKPKTKLVAKAAPAKRGATTAADRTSSTGLLGYTIKLPAKLVERYRRKHGRGFTAVMREQIVTVIEKDLAKAKK